MSEEIDRYQAAYKLANGKTRYDISYERGWFVFREPPWGITFRRVRRAELDEMTARLELRSKL